MKKKILIITTGGTLASSHSEEGLVPQLDSKYIFSRLEGMAKDYHIETLDLFSLDSSNVQPEEWQILADAVYDNLDHYDGIIIIHGTDTMAYTASALSYMLLNVSKPVVLTGSQLSILNPIADAEENCRLAINMAVSNVPGIFIAFNRKVILGCRAAKVRTISFDAFESINFPYVGVVNSNGLDLARYIINPPKEPLIYKRDLCTRVFLLKLIPGMDPDIFQVLYQMGYKGVYVEAFGIGGLPFYRRDMAKAIGDAIENGMTILVGSQCVYDGSNLSIYQTGQKIMKQGALQSYDMTTEAAVTKLMWTLGQTDDPREIRKYFFTSLSGEVNLPE